MTDDDHLTEKAYKSETFIKSRHARPMRILAEYLHPESRFSALKISDTIVFFGSARIRCEADARVALDHVRRDGGDIKAATKALEMSRYYEDCRELARRLTEWSKGLEEKRRRFVVCTGGGPGIMEAANRGASEAKGLNIGLGISIPDEQYTNPYVTRNLAFEFHYFFMRKFWFVYLAKALIAFPGGLGTLDEVFEVLTLIKTKKLRKRMPVLLYGSEYWRTVIDRRKLLEFGTVSKAEVDSLFEADDVDTAFQIITTELSAHALAKPGTTL
ncbi:MAG: LOG family protein [Hyphomicrobiales bacterium]|nr:LOG family protein [Hyphomicrobiales bacterium]